MSRGIDKMTQAMKYVEDAQLWIIGNGPKKQDYENLTKELELENKVKFLGNQKPTQLRLITPLADLGLSLEEDGRSEEHTSELQSRGHLVCRLLLEKKNRRN